MNIYTLTFKKLGDYWYADLPHDNPNDLALDRRLGRYLNKLDTWKEGFTTRVSLIEQPYYEDPDKILQFNEADIYRYFTTDDNFEMALFIGDREFTINSRLFFLFEQHYHLDLHEVMYKIMIE